jgi:predicted nucleic acid-binding protein
MWPQTIPYDLKLMLEASSPADCVTVVRTWAKRHNLKLKIQWFPNLERRLSELDEYRFTSSDQDRWARIKEWLEAKGVEAPDGLPRAPEIPAAD